MKYEITKFNYIDGIMLRLKLGFKIENLVDAFILTIYIASLTEWFIKRYIQKDFKL